MNKIKNKGDHALKRIKRCCEAPGSTGIAWGLGQAEERFGTVAAPVTLDEGIAGVTPLHGPNPLDDWSSSRRVLSPSLGFN